MVSDSETKIKSVGVISKFIFWTIVAAGFFAPGIPVLANFWVGSLGIWLLVPAVLVLFRPEISHSWCHVVPIFRYIPWIKVSSIERIIFYFGMVWAFLGGIFLILIAFSI